MLNSTLTKEFIKHKGSKYSTFLYYRFPNTIVLFHDHKLSLLSHSGSLDEQSLITALQILTNSKMKNTASTNEKTQDQGRLETC